MESEEIIIISPDSGSGGSQSTEDSKENLVMPFVGTYGSKKGQPGSECRVDGDCVVGAVCKKVSGNGHCVCEPPLINLGNGCVPMSGGGV